MKIKSIFCLFLAIICLSSCVFDNNETDPFPIVNDPVFYEEDADGFFILEDGYFYDYSKNDGQDISKIRFAESYPEEYTYKEMKLFIGNQELPLFNCKTNFSHSWTPDARNRMNNAVAILELEGKATFKLQTSFALLGECIIRPLAKDVEFKIDNNRRVITFEISEPGQYTIDLRSDRTLHLFVNEYQEFEEYKNEPNVIYFGKGIHNSKNSNYINDYNMIDINSNTTIYLEYGAIVEAGFIANNKNNIKIVGGGIVDGSKFKRHGTSGEKLVPFEFNYCTNLVFAGIVSTDPAGWVYNLYFCNNVELDNIKIISSRSNGDGVSVQSCQNVLCKNSFVRSWDDSLVVKNYPHWSNRNNHGTTKNIVFENCIIWTDLAQSMEIGFETVGKVMENITFNNITVLHNFHKAPISIHNANNAELKNVKFTNITIEDAAMGEGDENRRLIDFACEFSSTWSTNHTTTSLGFIDGVLVDNVLVIDCIEEPEIKLMGSVDTRDAYKNSEHYLNNITLSNIQIKDKILNENYTNLKTNMINNLIISNNHKVTGANIKRCDSTSYGRDYRIELI